MPIENQPGDPTFFQRGGPFALAAVADAARGKAEPAKLMLTGIAPLQVAGPTEVSFLDNRKFVKALAASKAGAVLVRPEFADKVPAGCVAILCEQPHASWARVASLFFPIPPAKAGIHPSAVVAASANVDPSAEVGPFVVVGENAVIGPRCRVAPFALIGDGVVMGRDCRIGPHVSVTHAILGDRVVLFPGARIGQDGFGFAISPEGFLSIPQVGRVILESDVEIGANTTIDRGAMDDTFVGAGTRADNLVQIGHNCRIGRCCVLVAQVGLSGSTVLEDFAMMGGQAGAAGHLRIGRGAKVAAQAGVISDVPAGAEYMGTPAMPVREFFRSVAITRRLAKRGGKQNGPEQEGP